MVDNRITNFRLVQVALPPLALGETIPIPEEPKIPASINIDVTGDGIRDRVSITIENGEVALYVEEGIVGNRERPSGEVVLQGLLLFGERKKIFPLKPEERIHGVRSIERFGIDNKDVAFTVVGIRKRTDGGDMLFRGAYLFQKEEVLPKGLPNPPSQPNLPSLRPKG